MMTSEHFECASSVKPLLSKQTAALVPEGSATCAVNASTGFNASLVAGGSTRPVCPPAQSTTDSEESEGAEDDDEMMEYLDTWDCHM
jgi:hypothetical protein